MKKEKIVDDVEEVKQLVIKAINLISEPIDYLEDNNIKLKEFSVIDIARGINLLEAAQTNMEIVCKKNDWNDEVCHQIGYACRVLGRCLAIVLTPQEDRTDDMFPYYEGEDGLSVLGKVLATLVVWNYD